MEKLFGHKVRVRVCGLLVQDNALLMVHLDAPTRPEPFWSVPGGGLNHGEKIEDALRREMLEETGLKVRVGPLFYVSEFIQNPFHAVELYFICEMKSGMLGVGFDPEFGDGKQIIKDVAFISLDQLSKTAIFPEFIRHQFLQDWRGGTNTPRWIRSDEP
jgi:ADP-ribose pyrophosphatase YjhB (NUDIX family)